MTDLASTSRNLIVLLASLTWKNVRIRGGRMMKCFFLSYCTKAQSALHTILVSGVLATTLLSPAVLKAQSFSVTFDDIKRISPQASDELVKAIIDAKADFNAAEINTPLRMAHFLTQVMTETGGVLRLDENMNYRFKTLLRTFSRQVISETKAREIAGKPQQIANWVYGARLGNKGRHTDDGWNYRGSGYIQLTGRTNFRVRGHEINVPLEASPGMARQKREGLLAAIAYWKARKINKAADDHDLRRVRILVNGPAAHGFDQSQVWFSRAWTRVFRAKASDGGVEVGEELASLESADESALFDDILSESGLLPEGFEAGTDAAAKRAAAIKAFQAELGLAETGILDEATQLELLDPREWRHRDNGSEAPARPDLSLDDTVVLRLDGAEAEAADAAPVEPETGSGKTVADLNLDDEDKAALADASAIYPDYERGGDAVDPSFFKPFSVIGPDTRVAVTDTKGFPDRAITLITFEDDRGVRRICTGTLVSSDTVLTAGHCIHSGTTAGQLFQKFRVIPARNVGAAPFGRCKGRQAFVLAGWTSALTMEESRHYDLGAIKLDCQVGEATGWLGVVAAGDEALNAETVVQGYAGDLTPTGRQWVSKDRLRIWWELKGFYQNDTYGGTSGAPVFSGATRDVLIGVHTNGMYGDEEPWKSYNAFTRITPERLARIQDWIDR